MKILLVLVIFLAGCAAGYRPLVDARGGQSVAAYEADLSACKGYAAQVVGPGTGAAVGAVAGAGLSYILGRITGGSTNQAMQAGALVGGVGGAAHGGESEVSVVRRCMVGRGWNVLN